MKLDNIIYDTESLVNALNEQWTADSPTFKAMYPSDTSTSLANVFASYGSMLQYGMVSALANCYTKTAFSEAGIYQLADTLGNTLHGNISAETEVKITKNNFVSSNIVIPAETTFIIDSKKFFNPTAIILPANVPTVDEIVLKQGEITDITKVSSGLKNEKFYFASDFLANHNYIKVFVNNEQWNIAESFLPYDSGYVADIVESNTVILKTDPDGRTYVQVGNGTLGSLPASNSSIRIRYASNDGENGNIGELGKTGTLQNSLLFTDSFGYSADLDVSVETLKPAFGGFSKQSLDTLKYSSPYVFASGNRAVRRQDYNAILQNKCGYLTSNVWGEYEEADAQGGYDSIMMNMVYYTGLKSFQSYPFYDIDVLTNPAGMVSSLNSVSGLWGSFIVRLKNLYSTSKYALLQDTGAKGILFINDNNDDPRDSLLPNWIQTTGLIHTVSLTPAPIESIGLGYNVNDELILDNTNNEIRIIVTSINETGGVLSIKLTTSSATQNYVDLYGNPFETTYAKGVGTGSGLKININITSVEGSTIITTNDNRSEIANPVQLNPIQNARSDMPDALYYQSLWEPSLLNPVQIIFDFGETDKGIAGFKFKASNPANGPFLGTIAVYAANNSTLPSTLNIRNSTEWTNIIARTSVINPYGNENENWTDWLATNCFKGEDDNTGEKLFDRYRYFVIEIYSCSQNETNESNLVTIGKIKALYEEDCSLLYYEDNGRTVLNFPTIGDPGPGTAEGYIEKSLINEEDFPIYSYTTTIEGVTAKNGYRDGNILPYAFDSGLEKIEFFVEVVNIDNGTFKVYKGSEGPLTGNQYISLITPGSLDTQKVYTHSLVEIPVDDRGVNYTPNDIITVNGSDGALELRVLTVNSFGGVLTAILQKNKTIDTFFEGALDTTVIHNEGGPIGTGLRVTLTYSLASGVDGVPGNGGTINITSVNNLSLDAAFTGNRIDTDSINSIDQPILNTYNHFTTFVEFKQPNVTQINISAEVKIYKDATVTSGVVLQEVKNSIQSLFEIKPDYIGKGLALSDIYKVINQNANVEWCKVKTPVDNIIIPSTSLMVGANIIVTEVI